jgi:hypothetical protein
MEQVWFKQTPWPAIRARLTGNEPQNIEQGTEEVRRFRVPLAFLAGRTVLNIS